MSQRCSFSCGERHSRFEKLKGKTERDQILLGRENSEGKSQREKRGKRRTRHPAVRSLSFIKWREWFSSLYGRDRCSSRGFSFKLSLHVHLSVRSLLLWWIAGQPEAIHGQRQKSGHSEGHQMAEQRHRSQLPSEGDWRWEEIGFFWRFCSFQKIGRCSCKELCFPRTSYFCFNDCIRTLQLSIDSAPITSKMLSVALE